MSVIYEQQHILSEEVPGIDPDPVTRFLPPDAPFELKSLYCAYLEYERGTGGAVAENVLAPHGFGSAELRALKDLNQDLATKAQDETQQETQHAA